MQLSLVPSTSFPVLDLENGLLHKVKHLVSLFHYVSLFDLKLAHGGKKADLIIVNTREEFLWLMIDITNRTVKAASKKVDFELDWDEENEEFNLKLLDNLKEQDALDKDGTYHPPQR